LSVATIIETTKTNAFIFVHKLLDLAHAYQPQYFPMVDVMVEDIKIERKMYDSDLESDLDQRKCYIHNSVYFNC
jgi:hypothetical protein